MNSIKQRTYDYLKDHCGVTVTSDDLNYVNDKMANFLRHVLIESELKYGSINKTLNADEMNVRAYMIKIAFHNRLIEINLEEAQYLALMMHDDMFKFLGVEIDSELKELINNGPQLDEQHSKEDGG